MKSKCPFEDGHYVQTKKTWYEAREDCIGRGTDLHVNEDMDVNVCDLTKTKYKNTWIGIRNVRWMVPDKDKTGYIYFFILFNYTKCTMLTYNVQIVVYQ